MTGEIAQGANDQDENTDRSDNVNWCVAAVKFDHATGYQRERDGLGENPKGCPQEKVAVPYGRQRQETIDDKPADGELPHGED